MLTDAQRLQQVQLLEQSAATTQGYDLAAVERRFLEAIRVSYISAIFPGPEKVPAQQHYRNQIEQMSNESRLQEQKVNIQLEALKLLGEADLNQAKIAKLQAEVFAIMQQTRGAQTQQQISIINAQIGAAKAKQDTLLKAAAILQRSIQAKEKDSGESTSDNGAGMDGLEDEPSDDMLQQATGDIPRQPETAMGLG